MGRAVILTTVSKANLTGGTFADSLTAAGTDTTTVAAYNSGGARILEMWGINSDSVGELQMIYTRPESTHDQQHGVRLSMPGTAVSGAGTLAAFDLLGVHGIIPLAVSDIPTIQVSGSAGDDVVVSYVTEYDDLANVSVGFALPQTIENLRKSTFGFRVSAQASGTPGSYGTARAINADDDRFHAGSWYAIRGITVQLPVTTVSLIGPDWGGFRIGCPGSMLIPNSSSWFVDQSIKWGKPMIPCFQANNKSATLVAVNDAEASTAAQIDFECYELTGAPF
jgi:hypothetical protein